MSYIGSTPPGDAGLFKNLSETFSGNGSNTQFTLGYRVNKTADIEVVVNNVQQNPSDGSYTVSNYTTLVFSEAPSSNTNNIFVYYRTFSKPAASADLVNATFVVSNSTLQLETSSVTYDVALPTSNSTVKGLSFVVDQVNNTSITVSASANSVKSAYDLAANAVANAATAYTNAASYADAKAANAYSNAASYADSKAATAYTNAASYADAKAANAYSNAVSYADTKAGDAYSNATSYADAKASNAYSNAVSYTDAKAANAYSNAVSYADTKAGDAYSNAVSYADSKAANAYSNAASYADAKAANAYSNAASYADAKAANAYSNVFLGGTFTGPVTYQANVTANNVSLNGNMQIDGNLTVSGNTVSINVTNLSVEDNMIYLNANNTVSNPDLGFAGNYNDGSYRHAGVFRDATDGVWKFFHEYVPEPDASAYIDTANNTFALANVQANTFIGAGSFSLVTVAGNTTVGLSVGNSTVNTVITSASINTNGTLTANTISVGNTTVNSIITGDSISVGNSTVNSFVNSTSIVANGALIYSINATSIATGTLDTARLPATANISTAINVGANVNLTTSGISIGNSTVNTVFTSASINTNGTLTANTVSVGNVEQTQTNLQVDPAGTAFLNALIYG